MKFIVLTLIILGDIMYKYHEVIGIRKIKWDMLWHILYKMSGKITWDRVCKDEAMKVEKYYLK